MAAAKLSMLNVIMNISTEKPHILLFSMSFK